MHTISRMFKLALIISGCKSYSDLPSVTKVSLTKKMQVIDQLNRFVQFAFGDRRSSHTRVFMSPRCGLASSISGLGNWVVRIYTKWQSRHILPIKLMSHEVYRPPKALTVSCSIAPTALYPCYTIVSHNYQIKLNHFLKCCVTLGWSSVSVLEWNCAKDPHIRVQQLLWNSLRRRPVPLAKELLNRSNQPEVSCSAFREVN